MRDILNILAILLGMALSEYVTAEDWLCTTESGQRIGNTILACGIGDGLEEARSRKLALHNAIDEFETICQMSVDCVGKKTIVEPKRTQCLIEKNGLIKCYRLIQVTILE